MSKGFWKKALGVVATVAVVVACVAALPVVAGVAVAGVSIAAIGTGALVVGGVAATIKAGLHISDKEYFEAALCALDIIPALKVLKLGKKMLTLGKAVVGARPGSLIKRGFRPKQIASKTVAKKTSGETIATKIGKQVHARRAEIRKASGKYDSVNEVLRDEAGNKIMVPKRVNTKTGIPSQKTQSVIPDAVKKPPRGQIIDDKPLGRPISKDYQEIRRNIEAYEIKYGEPPHKIIIERYNPKTGAPAGTEIFTPKDFIK
ncbi:MAG: hypothetical protein FWG53_02405 [Clostridiales bacterium]|nr:hypothetical protein [Clostridiales bacterium]